MTAIDTLKERNHDFATHQFSSDLTMLPTLRTMIISCVDPRVDPTHVLGLKLGEAIVIRNIAGRITPATFQTMAMLQTIAQTQGVNPGSGFNIIVLHHTDCGITHLTEKTDMLASYFGIDKTQLEEEAISDPRAAVAIDVAAIKANPRLPRDWAISGLVYDVKTGLVETVVSPEPVK